jgi:hypothetical protein
LYRQFYFPAVSSGYYRQFYRHLSNMVAQLRDGHSTLESDLLGKTLTDLGTPAIFYDTSFLDACGMLIDGEYVVYEAGKNNSLGLVPGDKVLDFGPDTDFAGLYQEWQQEARCGDNSFQFEHHAFRAFQNSLFSMATWYGQMTVQHLNGERELLSLRDIPLVHTYCFGYPLPYETRTGMRIYTDQITAGVLYLNVLSFYQLPAQYNDLYRKMSGQAGIIIDLRGNSGGRPKSSAALVSPFLKTTYAFHCRTTDGSSSSDITMTADPIEDFHGKIAILVNETSKSGADFAVYAFLHGDVIGPVRVFGAPMAGLFSATTSSNIGYTVNGQSDSLTLGVTIAECTNAAGENLDGEYITPQEQIAFSHADIQQGNDPVIQRALAWIAEK